MPCGEIGSGNAILQTNRGRPALSDKKRILGKPSGAQPIPGIYDPRPPSLRIVNPQNSEQIHLNLLKIYHSCLLLQQLIPSYLLKAWPHLLQDWSRKLHDSPPANYPIVMSLIPTVTDERRQAVVMQLSVNVSECLEIECLTQSL